MYVVLIPRITKQTLLVWLMDTNHAIIHNYIQHKLECQTHFAKHYKWLKRGGGGARDMTELRKCPAAVVTILTWSGHSGVVHGTFFSSS